MYTTNRIIIHNGKAIQKGKPFSSEDKELISLLESVGDITDTSKKTTVKVERKKKVVKVKEEENEHE